MFPNTPDHVGLAYFNPVSTMPSWTQAMRRAVHAERSGQVAQAMAFYQLALTQAQHWLLGTGSPSADECLGALVSSHLCLAELLQSDGETDGAARGLAHVHQAACADVSPAPPSGCLATCPAATPA